MSDLPLDRVCHWERTRPDEIFVTQPRNGVARDWTWAEATDEARRVANRHPIMKHHLSFIKNSQS
jgi:hypothetical protein